MSQQSMTLSIKTCKHSSFIRKEEQDSI